MEKTVSEAISYRRSTRAYKNQSIDSEKVKQCLFNASLAVICNFGSFIMSLIKKH